MVRFRKAIFHDRLAVAGGRVFPGSKRRFSGQRVTPRGGNTEWVFQLVAGGYLGMVLYQFYSIESKLNKLEDVSEISHIHEALKSQGILRARPKETSS